MLLQKASRILGALVLAATALPATAQPPRPFMGVLIKQDPDGVVIEDVFANGPADLAWLRTGDVIQGMIIAGKNDRPVRTAEDLRTLISQLSADDTVMVRYQRRGKKRIAEITFRTEPRANGPRAN